MDFNKIMQEELDERRKGNMFQGYQSPEQPPKKADAHISIDDEETDLNEVYGPAQVQSLLGLVVDFPLRKKFADAGDDADAVHHLNKLKAPR